MNTVAGIFNSRADAERAVEDLRASGVGEDQISLLAPGTTQEQLDEVPTTDTEQPGIGKALGGAVGGALGVAGGLQLGAAAASLLVPGVGPVFAVGLVAAALLGVGGAATGAVLGGTLEDSMARGLPHDELFVYEDALRHGRSVVIVVADDDYKAGVARNLLSQAGAESVDAARASWWVGLRVGEEAEYTVDGAKLTTRTRDGCETVSVLSVKRARSGAGTSAANTTSKTFRRGLRVEGYAPEHLSFSRYSCDERAHHQLVCAHNVSTMRILRHTQRETPFTLSFVSDRDKTINLERRDQESSPL